VCVCVCVCVDVCIDLCVTHLCQTDAAGPTHAAKPQTVSASLVVVLEDARATALLAAASYAVVLADARPAALLALASYAVVLVEHSWMLEPPHLLASAFYAAVLLCSQMPCPLHCWHMLKMRRSHSFSTGDGKAYYQP
jgi:hypothetical protein